MTQPSDNQSKHWHTNDAELSARALLTIILAFVKIFSKNSIRVKTNCDWIRNSIAFEGYPM